MDKQYFVYMLASGRNGTIYTGATGDIAGRILVWYEAHEDVSVAREKQIKGWNRAWKIRLIEKENSGWNNLYGKLVG